jgi:hypothetical protein
MTSKQAGYQSPNHAAGNRQDTANNAAFDIKGTVDAIANLATSTASDGATITSLSKTNASINAKLEQHATQLAATCAEVAMLKREVATLKGTNTLSRRWRRNCCDLFVRFGLSLCRPTF